MRQLLLLSSMLLALLAVPNHASALSEQTDARPIQLIMPFPPGGTSNAIVLELARAMSRALATEVEVVNRGGLAGARGWLELAAARADGQTIGFLAMPAFLAHYVDPSWEAKFRPADFTPIARVWAIPYGIAVPSNSPIRDLPGLVAEARARPGSFLIATGGRFSAEHILIAMIERAAGVRFDTAHFSLGPQTAARALAGSHVDALVANALHLSGDVVRKTARVLGVASETTDPALPGVALMREVGVPVVYEELGVIAAPKGLPSELIKRFEGAVEKALADAEFLAALRRAGAIPSFRGSASISGEWASYDAEIGAAILWMRQ